MDKYSRINKKTLEILLLLGIILVTILIIIVSIGLASNIKNVSNDKDSEKLVIKDQNNQDVENIDMQPIIDPSIFSCEIPNDLMGGVSSSYDLIIFAADLAKTESLLNNSIYLHNNNDTSHVSRSVISNIDNNDYYIQIKAKVPTIQIDNLISNINDLANDLNNGILINSSNNYKTTAFQIVENCNSMKNFNTQNAFKEKALLTALKNSNSLEEISALSNEIKTIRQNYSSIISSRDDNKYSDAMYFLNYSDIRIYLYKLKG